MKDNRRTRINDAAFLFRFGTILCSITMGFALGGCAQETPLPNLAPTQLHSQVPLPIIAVRAARARKMLADMVAGRVRPKGGIQCRISVHRTAICPGGFEILLPPDFRVKKDAVPPPCGWSGLVPPNCSFNTGAFRRVYNPNYQNGAVGEMTTYNNSTTMPEDTGEDHGKNDAGYIYIEGWPSPVPSNDSEAGLFFAPPCLDPGCYVGGGEVSAYYRAFATIAGSTPTYLMGTNFYNPGDSMEVAVASAGSGETAALYVVVEDLTTSAYDSFGPPQTDSAGWTGNCCVMARMTTIAQSGDNFGDGNLFGPIDWTEEDLDSGSYGTQCYPNNANIIEVSGFSDDPWQETDTIDLSGASGGSCSD